MIVLNAARHRQAAGAVVALAVVAFSTDAVRAQQVGTAAAVNPAAQARGTGGARTVVIGQSIAHRERIQTTSGGSVQLLFLDKTSMTIGPNSDLAIDEYVYDPNSNTGKMAATLTKGVMRFVGGQISHAGNAQITTPNAVVGIRGGVGIIGTQQVFIGYGEGSVTSGSSSVTLSAGEYTQTQGGGVPPTSPAPPPPGLISSLVATFQSQGGQGGGAPASGSRVSEARATATGSPGGTIATATAAAAVATSSQSWSPVTSAVVSSINQTIGTTAQTAVATESANEIVQRQFGPVAFAFNVSNCCAIGQPTSNAPYLPSAFTAGGGNRYISPVMGYRLPSVDVANRAPYFQWGIDITGDGPAQTSWFFVMTGALVEDNAGGFTLSSGFGATRRGAANISIGRATGAVSSRAGTVVLDDARLPLSGEITQQDFVATTRQYRDVQAFYFPGGGGASVNYDFSQQIARVSAPSSLGANRPADVLTGWTGGLIRTLNQSTNTFVGPSFPTLGFASVALNPSLNRIQANFNVANIAPSVNDSFQYASYQMGSLDLSLRGRSGYVDYDNFAAREAIVASNDGVQQTQLSSINGQSLQNSATFMVNVPRAVALQLGPDTTFCECDYTRWGFWSTDSNRVESNGAIHSDRGHLLTWVAGRMPNANEVPSTGTATYLGHVVANIRNVSTTTTEYVASGNLSNTINFATRTGSANVSGLDGVNYSGSLQLSGSDPRFFGGGLTGAGRTMVMTGNLFRGVSSPVGEMGGNVYISGTNYIGSGIFAGRMR